MAAAAAASKVTLKLLVDTNANRVLFAEAGKDFIDFLFNTLSLPLGTIIRLLTKEEMVGSFGNLYQSIETLNDNYIQPNQSKDTLLKPKSATPNLAKQVPDLLPLDYAINTVAPQKSFYTCCRRSSSHSHCSTSYVTDNPKASCPKCGETMSTSITYVAPPSVGAIGIGGFVKELVTYMVMDDLAVMPLSTISSITLLNKCNVRDIGALEERIVDVGIDEGVKLLKESLQSKRVLTNVFLEKKPVKTQVDI